MHELFEVTKESGSPTTYRSGTRDSNVQLVQVEVAERSTSTSTSTRAQEPTKPHRTEGPLEVAMEQQQHEQQQHGQQRQQQSGRPTARRLEAEDVRPVQVEADRSTGNDKGARAGCS